MEQQIRDVLDGMIDAQYNGKSIIAEILNSHAVYETDIRVFGKQISLLDLKRARGPVFYLGKTEFLTELMCANIHLFKHVIARSCTDFRYLSGRHFATYKIGSEIWMYDVRVDKQICPKELYLNFDMYSRYASKQIPSSIGLEEVRILCAYKCDFNMSRKIPNLLFLGLDTDMFTPYQYNKIIEKYKPKHYFTDDEEHLSEVRELLKQKEYWKIGLHFSKVGTKSARKVA